MPLHRDNFHHQTKALWQKQQTLSVRILAQGSFVNHLLIWWARTYAPQAYHTQLYVLEIIKTRADDAHLLFHTRRCSCQNSKLWSRQTARTRFLISPFARAFVVVWLWDSAWGALRAITHHALNINAIIKASLCIALCACRTKRLCASLLVCDVKRKKNTKSGKSTFSLSF